MSELKRSAERSSMHLKLDFILGSVLLFYLKLGAIFAAHHFAKFYTTKKRSCVNPRAREKIFRYLTCIAATALIGLFASVTIAGGEEEGYYAKSVDYNRGAIVFVALLIPAALGVSSGFTAEDREFPSGDSQSGGDI
jgi:hypothetical protein